MSELWIGTIAFFGLLLTAVGCWLYMAGGRSGKWKRRFIGSLVLSAAVWLEFLLMGKFSFWTLLIYPLTIGTFCLGYGAEQIGEKIMKRSFVVSASLMTSLGIFFLYGGWAILPIDVIIASTTVYLGVKNPVHAAAEEFFICLMLWSPKLIYPFII